MPFIDFHTTRKLSGDEKKALNTGLGEAITNLPGKPEDCIILSFNDDRTMFFFGEEQKEFVFLSIAYCGKYDANAKRAFTIAAVQAIRSVLGIPEDKISMKISEHVGWVALNNYREIDNDGKLIP